MTRCGIIAIIGRPNAGKSTLINHLVGGKVSIVTPKAQTTRFNIRGVCVKDQSQLIFVDTPGIFDADRQFEKAMVKAAWAGIGDADMTLMILDAKRGLKDGAVQIMTQLKSHSKKQACLAINKIDAVEKKVLLDLATACDAHKVFERIFMISALKGDGVEDVKAWLAGKVPPGPFLYPEDQMSDISMRLLAAEITREKLFIKLKQELPYAAFVETERWEENDTQVKISQLILVQREGQKRIVIGEKGGMLKAIGTSARKELEKVIGKSVHLSLFVKVKPDWKENRESYRLLGLDFKSS